VNIIGLDMNVLTGWYQSKVNTSLTTTSARALSAGQSGSSGATALPPWDVRGDILSLEEMSRKVLANGVFFRSPDSEFSDTEAPDDHKSLFSLHQGLKRLAALAEEAKEKSTTDTRRSFLDTRFAAGISQLDSYFEDLDLEGVNLLKGEELRKMESEVAISRGLSQFKTGTIHTGVFDDEVTSLTGDAQFTVSVTKSGITTDVAIDLADMGATTRNVDNIAEHINTELEAAGMISRFERTKIGEEDEDGVIPGNNWGFLIKGVSTESLEFSAVSASPAVYFAGVSGINDSAGGQIVKLTDIGSGTPQVGFSRRFDADPDTVQVDVPGSETGETRTKSEANPLEIHASAGSSDGGIFVVGHTSAASDGQALKGAQDLVLAKYDSVGNRVWSRVLGAAEDAEGTSISVDSSGNVVVAGNVTGDLGDTTDVGGSDAIVAKYDSAGVEQWVRRMGGTGNDEARSVAVDDDGTVYVAGKSASAFGGEVHGGGLSDGFIRAIDADGVTLYTRRVGTNGDESIASIAIADDGDLLVASEEGGNAVLRKFAAADGDSAQVWEQDLGTLDGGRVGDLVVDGTSIYMTGAGGSGFAPSAPVGAHAGGIRDAFVVKMTDGASASIDYTTFVGSDADDSGASVEIHDGKIYIAGKTTGGVAGGTQIGDRDAFAAQLDATTGSLDWATQISGRGGLAEAKGLVVRAAEDSILDDLGLPTGKLVYSDSRVVTDRSSARDGDHFYVSVDGGRRKKVTIDADDSMRSLTFKINAALILDGTADVRRASEGDMLRIKAAEGKTIELFAGSTGKDLLQSLGMKPGAIINTGSLLDKDAKTSDAPTIFAMELPNKISLGDVDLAAAARESLEMAMSVVQRAYRDLTLDPAIRDLLAGPKAGRSGGTVPAHMTAQMNNYAAGLARLNAGPAAGSGVFF
jgi:hypothetical protein